MLTSHDCLSLFQDIDDYICQAKDKGYDTLVHFGRKGLNVAATAAVMAATKVMQTLGICFVVTSGYCRACYVVCYSHNEAGLLNRALGAFFVLFFLSGRSSCLL